MLYVCVCVCVCVCVQNKPMRNALLVQFFDKKGIAAATHPQKR